MTLLTMNGALHGLAAGTTITTGNSAVMGTALSAVTAVNGGTVTAATNGVRFLDPPALAGDPQPVARADWNGLLNGTACSIEVELDPCSTPGGGEMRLATVRNPANTADVAFVQLLTTRQVRVYNSAVTSLWTMATPLPTGGGSRVHVGINLAAGTLEVNVYTASDGKSESAVESKAAHAVNWNGATTVGGLRFGAITSATSWDQVFRNVRISDTQSAPLGPLNDAPPIVDVGADQTVEPRETVTLTATHVSGTTPDAWTWVQVSGLEDAVLDATGNTCDVTVPATFTGGTVVVGVTPAAGANTGAQDTVTLTVPAHTLWGMLPGGVEWLPAGPAVPWFYDFDLAASAEPGLYDLVPGGGMVTTAGVRFFEAIDGGGLTLTDGFYTGV